MSVELPPQRRERVEEFRRKHRTGLVTLVFTDIVGSTQLKQELGDRQAVALIQRHHAVVRELLAGFVGAREISTAGDSFFLAFDKPSDAVKFALLLLGRLRQLAQEGGHALADRIGIHVGEVVIEQEASAASPKDLYGIHVDICARVMGLAGANQILLTRSAFDNARAALRGEDVPGVGELRWANHGPYLLKGVEEPVEICEVRAAEGVLTPPATTEKAQRHVSPDAEPVLGWRPAIDQVVPNTQWVLEKKLGEGGFGEVWLGRHRTMKERRVFKFCFRADRVRSLKREMTLFRVLKERVGDHPNIVRLLEVYFEEPPFYVVMDYVEGNDLARWCEQQGGAEKVPLEAKLEIVAQVAEALQAAHDAGVIHRDVKPGNILVSNPKSEIRNPKSFGVPPSGGHGEEPAECVRSTDAEPAKAGTPNPQLTVKLTDFGIGQVVSEEALKGVTKAGFTQTILADSSSSQTGSQMYMAPELLAGKPASTRSDIYSLGVLLYQLLAGDFSKPITTDWAADILDPLLKDDLQHCFAGNPQDRFAGAGQLAKNLRALPERQQALTKQQAELAAREKTAYRHGLVRATSFAAIVVVLVSCLAITAWRQSRIARSQSRIARNVAHSLRENLYVADMNMAHRALEVFNFSRAVELVDNYQPPKAGESELRGFEWRYLWQQTRGNQIKSFTNHNNIVSCVAFSPDGRLLASVSWDNKIEIRDLARGQVVTNLSVRGWVGRYALAFSPGGKILAVFQVGQVQLYDTLTWRELRKFEHDYKPRRGDPPYNTPIAFSPDGRTLADSPGDDGKVLFWDTLDWTQRKPPLTTNLPGFGLLLAYSPDGKLLVTGSYDQVQVWDVETMRLMSVSKQFSPASIAYSPDGRWLAVGDLEGFVRIWDAPDLSKEPRRFAADSSIVWSLVFSADSKTLITGGDDHALKVWELATLQQVHQFQGQASQLWSLALSPDGRLLAGGTKDGPVLIWDAQATSEKAGFKEALRPLGFSEDGTRLFVVDTNMTFSSFDLATKQSVKSVTLPLDYQSTRPRAVSTDLKNVAFWISTNRVEIWDLESASIRISLTNRTGFTGGMRFSPDNQLVALNCHESALEFSEGSVEVWDVSTGRLVVTCKAMSGLVFSPDSRMLAGGTVDYRIKVVNLVTKAEFIFPPGHRLYHTQAAFSPDGKLLATASYDADVRLWNVEAGRASYHLKGHKHEVHCVTFSPDGRTLVTGSADGEVKFWSVATGKELFSVRVPGESVNFARFSPDARTLVLQDSRHIFRVPSLAEIDALRQTKSKGD